MFYLLLQSYICECYQESGTRLALDISLYVIDNSLKGNKQELLISGRKKGEFIAAKIFKIDVIRKIDYRYIAMRMWLSFMILYTGHIKQTRPEKNIHSCFLACTRTCRSWCKNYSNYWYFVSVLSCVQIHRYREKNCAKLMHNKPRC